MAIKTTDAEGGGAGTGTRKEAYRELNTRALHSNALSRIPRPQIGAPLSVLETANSSVLLLLLLFNETLVNLSYWEPSPVLKSANDFKTGEGSQFDNIFVYVCYRIIIMNRFWWLSFVCSEVIPKFYKALFEKSKIKVYRYPYFCSSAMNRWLKPVRHYCNCCMLTTFYKSCVTALQNQSNPILLT